MLAQHDSVVGLVDGGKPNLEDGREVFRALMPESATLLNLAVTRFARRLGSPAVCLDCPNILNWRSGLRFGAPTGPVLQEFFDVVSNPVAPLSQAGPTPSGDSPRAPDSFETPVRQGVVDTILEGVLLGDAPGGYSATGFFEAASKQGIATAVVRAGDHAALDRIGLPPDAASIAATSLREGYQLVLPTRAVTVDGTARFCWWRVDARTGETIGVLDTGFHQANADYAQTVRVGAVRAAYRQVSKKAAKWVATRGIQFYDGWSAPPWMGSLVWDWSLVAIFALVGVCLAGGIGVLVWLATRNPYAK